MACRYCDPSLPLAGSEDWPAGLRPDEDRLRDRLHFDLSQMDIQTLLETERDLQTVLLNRKWSGKEQAAKVGLHPKDLTKVLAGKLPPLSIKTIRLTQYVEKLPCSLTADWPLEDLERRYLQLRFLQAREILNAQAAPPTGESFIEEMRRSSREEEVNFSPPRSVTIH